MITEDDVAFCYRYFLKREPENDDVLAEKIENCKDVEMLVGSFVNSEEYKNCQLKNPDFIEHQIGYFGLPPMDIHDCTEDERKAVFMRTQREWGGYGETQPFWSVLTNENYKTENINEQIIKDFYDTGRHEVDNIISTLQRNQLITSARDLKDMSALELGCGVGRVTCHLQEIFSKVYGIDISQGNLDVAKKYVLSNVELVRINTIDQYKSLPGVDFEYTTMVLQHNCPTVIEYIVDALLARLNICGIAMLELPTYRKGYMWNYESYISTEEQMELHVLPQYKMFEIIHRNGCVPIEVSPYPCTGVDDNSTMYTIKKIK